MTLCQSPQELTAAGRTCEPFHPEAVGLLHELSDCLMRDNEARAYPELVSLGFALRPAEIEALRTQFHQLAGSGRILAPRGLVFQIAAGNVDTLFVYTWVFALLTGNRSIIRLPSKETKPSAYLCRLIENLLDGKPMLRAANHFIRYGHEREITTALSAACDVRAIWGGDATINAIRSIPLGPQATELTFADRYSLAAIRADAYLSASPATKQQVIRDFWNDAFVFDQRACSSPRLVVWCGTPQENATASETFFHALEAEAARRVAPMDGATKMRKFLYLCETAMDEPVAGCQQYPHLTVIQAENLEHFRREHCGGGLFFDYQTYSLPDIAPYLTRKDQTLVHFGFEKSELQALARRLNGNALDRIVPIGQALRFGRFWDGYDLLAAFTRSVAIG